MAFGDYGYVLFQAERSKTTTELRAEDARTGRTCRGPVQGIGSANRRTPPAVPLAAGVAPGRSSRRDTCYRVRSGQRQA